MSIDPNFATSTPAPAANPLSDWATRAVKAAFSAVPAAVLAAVILSLTLWAMFTGVGSASAFCADNAAARSIFSTPTQCPGGQRVQ
jgi:hypothetical protein